MGKRKFWCCGEERKKRKRRSGGPRGEGWKKYKRVVSIGLAIGFKF